VTTEIRYDGPGHVLVVDAKTTIMVGKTGKVSDEVAQSLVDCSYADVTIVGGAGQHVWPSSHAAIDELAATLGVELPEPEQGKQKAPVAAKIAALEAAGFTPESAAAAASTPNEGDER
jgi:hypothetical protein